MKSTLLVFGFAREIRKARTISTITPIEVINLIILFVYTAIPDLSMMDISKNDEININNIVQYLRYKYSDTHGKRSIYTSIGNTLISINPYKDITKPQEENILMNQFIKSQQNGIVLSNKPHPFTVASRAFLTLSKTKRSQYIIIQGETGSGKVCYHLNDFIQLSS